MSALLSGLTDRNSVIQKSCAFAMGHLVRVSWISCSVKYSSGNCKEVSRVICFADFTGQQH